MTGGWRVALVMEAQCPLEPRSGGQCLSCPLLLTCEDGTGRAGSSSGQCPACAREGSPRDPTMGCSSNHPNVRLPVLGGVG